MLEKQIEKAVCDYAKSKGLLHYKFTSPGHLGVPDRMFVTKRGTIFFIEFKSESGKTTPSQEREIARLAGHNVTVFVVHGVDNGKDIIDAFGNHGE